MPSHLADVGFYFSNDNYYDELIKTFDHFMQRSSRTVTVGDKTYLVLYVDRDIEFWLPVGKGRTIDPASFELHFNTHRWDDAVKTAWVSKGCRDMQGIASLWQMDESYPLNVTVPNAICTPELGNEKVYKVQISCFAETLKVYKSEEDFHKEYEQIGIQAFMPIGKFAENDGDAETSRAWLSGTVKRVQKRENSYTKREFYHLLVESYGMDYDVLVDAEYVKSIDIGDTVVGEMWLSGKLRVRYEGDDFANLNRQKAGNNKLRTLDDLYNILRKSWSRETAHPSCHAEWTDNDPSFGQCAITAMLVADMFGGTIHRIRFKNGSTHYFNCIDGHYVDLTREQFDLYDETVEYEPNEKMSREYCGKNANTKARYDLLIKRVLDNLK